MTENLEENFYRRAGRYRQNATYDADGVKRHDQLTKGEAMLMYRAYQGHLSIPKIAVIFKRDKRVVASHINKLQQVKSGDSELKPAVMIKLVPTWYPAFASRLRKTICFPDPMRFLIFDTKMGEFYIEDNDGSIYGCFFWYRSKQNEIIIRLYEYQTDVFLDNTGYYKLALKFKPKLKILLVEYNNQAKNYIVRANDLMQTITHNVKGVITDRLKSTIEDTSLRSFMHLPASARKLSLDIKDIKQKTKLEIRRDFFTTIYAQVIRNTRKYEGENLTYAVLDAHTESGYTKLLFDGITLASGAKEDLQRLADVHKDVIEFPGNNQIAQDIYQLYERLLKVKDDLYLEL